MFRSGLKLTLSGEHIQSLLPQSQVVKAFCTMGTAVMKSTDFGNGNIVTTFVASDHEGAKRTVTQLAKDAAFDSVDVYVPESACYSLTCIAVA